MYDEPLALSAVEQAHFDGCAECRTRFEAVANGARAATALLSVPSFEPETAAALNWLNVRIAREKRRPARWYERWVELNSPRLRPLATPAIAVLLAASLLTGVGAYTGVIGKVIRVFEPTQLVAVPVSPSVNPNIVRLDFGATTWEPQAPTAQQATDPTAAQRESGLPVLTPASLPNGVQGPVRYEVIPHATGSLTFDANRLRASAAAAGVRVSPMPSSINGSTLIVNAGPALIEVWGSSASGAEAQVPTLVIAQTRVPTVDSTGASTAQLEDYLLSQPGVPPDLAAEIKAIKDPSTTLPIPIPQGFATTESVKVNGVNGLLIKAGLGAGVVWVRNGVIYAVGGQLTPDQVLAIATSLH
jgi:hypothetical protein